MNLLQASQHDTSKDATFGTVFLIIWKMVHIYAKRAVFKDIDARNYQIASWFENCFPEERFTHSHTTGIMADVAMADVEVLIQKVIIIDPMEGYMW